MPDREKAIRILEGNYKNFVLRHNNELLTVNALIALLKAQEPVEPIMVNGEPECGACRYELRPDADSYCPCCGRKVKWE